MIGKTFRISLTAAAFLAAAVAACTKPPARTAPISYGIQARITEATPVVLRQTVGEFSAFIDSAPIQVEGWGVVAGLPHTGSGNADPKIREYLINQLVIKGVGLYSEGTADISPEAILGSDQVSVVEVRGVIPPLARKGSTFDLYTNALPNSGTTSLENGLLWPADLKQIGLTLAGNDTRTLALGRGPVFIPSAVAAAGKPGEKQSVETSAALRSGHVLAGGVCQEDRQARLQVYVPDYNMTQLIERSINAKFPGRDKVADAQDQSVIALHVPPEYYENPADFVDLVRHIYLVGDNPGFNQDKARELIHALAQPGQPYRDLGLALQGLGRSILWDYIQPNYTNANPNVRFWCAHAGACMQDVEGLTVLEEMVKDATNPMRRQALLAIIEASRGRDTTQATVALYDMLASFNTDDRILAYHALLAIRSRGIASYSLGKKFMMDIVPSDGPPLIYVLESDSPRIAFIGKQIELAPGAVYLSQDKLLTVSADMVGVARPPALDRNGRVITADVTAGGPGAPAASQPKDKENVTLFWRSPLGGRSAEIRTVARLPELIARASWVPDPNPQDPFNSKDNGKPFIGASYQRVTEMLATMCAEKTIDATFITQRAPEAITNPADIAISGRPEGSTKIVLPPAPPPSIPEGPQAPMPMQMPSPAPGPK